MKLACADNGALWAGVGAPSSLGVSAPHVLGENAAVHRVEGTRGAGVDAQHAPQLLLPLLLLLHDCRGAPTHQLQPKYTVGVLKSKVIVKCFGFVFIRYGSGSRPQFLRRNTDPDPKN
jgi:hypothetical protein